MRHCKLFILGSVVMLLIPPPDISSGTDSQDIVPNKGPSMDISPTEAPTGFDLQTNRLTEQMAFDADRAVLRELETIADGIGPVYNARSCAECHTNPVTGGNSQVSELCAGHFDGKQFIEHPGGSLIQ